MHCERRTFRTALPCDLLDPGGANRDRTGDLLLAKQALSQLSYGPRVREHCDRENQSIRWRASVGGSGWIRTIDPRLIKTML
jgi:hypothetical protein